MMEDHIVMFAFNRAHWGEDDIRMTCRFIEVKVDTDEKIKSLKGAFKLRPVRGCEDGISLPVGFLWRCIVDVCDFLHLA